MIRRDKDISQTIQSILYNRRGSAAGLQVNWWHANVVSGIALSDPDGSRSVQETQAFRTFRLASVISDIDIQTRRDFRRGLIVTECDPYILAIIETDSS